MRIVGLDFGAMRFQVFDDLFGGGLAEIVYIGLVGDAEDADARAVERELDPVQFIL